MFWLRQICSQLCVYVGKLTWVHLYASSAVHSECDVGFDNEKMTGLCIYNFRSEVIQLSHWSQKVTTWTTTMFKIQITSLKEAIASITSLVKALPTPDVPISTVGLMDYRDNRRTLGDTIKYNLNRTISSESISTNWIEFLNAHKEWLPWWHLTRLSQVRAHVPKMSWMAEGSFFWN